MSGIASRAPLKSAFLAVTLLFPAISFGGTPLRAGAAPAPSRKLAQIRRLVEAKDDLGLRIYVQRIYSEPIQRGEWKAVRNTLTLLASRVGPDLIRFWDARNPGDLSPVDLLLSSSDSLMMAGRFEEAFQKSQEAARVLKVAAPKDPEAAKLLPYAHHSMARALYGARRYEDSMRVYQWIGADYPEIRQVLFEKMWAAFKSGRVDIALGAIASQRSPYFPMRLQSESYLLQTYLLRRLCRENDLAQIENELKYYEQKLSKGGLAEWVETDFPSLVLWRLTRTPKSGTELTDIVSRLDRDTEKKKILNALTKRYEKQKPALLKNLSTVRAFQNLAVLTDTSTLLKPVESLKDRDQLLKMDLEVWPSDSGEEWLDEIGKHVLIGESLCGKKNSS